MTAYTDHMQRVHKHAPAPEDAIPHILTEQRQQILRYEMARRMEAGDKPVADALAEYFMMVEDQQDRQLFLADWCAMYIPTAVLRQALAILTSIQQEE